MKLPDNKILQTQVIEANRAIETYLSSEEFKNAVRELHETISGVHNHFRSVVIPPIVFPSRFLSPHKKE